MIRYETTRFLLLMSGFMWQALAGYTNAQNGSYPGMNLRGIAGTRALALGGAYVAVANDVTAGYWNPAGLSQLPGVQFGITASLLSFERKYAYAAAAFPTASLGTFGASWLNFSVAGLRARDQSGTIIGEIANNETAFLFSHSMQWRKRFAFGTTIKLLTYNLFNNRALGTGYDIGFLFKPVEIVNIGGTLQNIAASYVWNTPAKTKERFPRIARFGLNLRPVSNVNLSVDLEVFCRRDGQWRFRDPAYRRWHAGAEVCLYGKLALQVGHDDQYLTLGTSLLMQQQQSGNALELGYSTARDSFGEGLAHHLSILLRFNGASERKSGRVDRLELLPDKIPIVHARIVRVEGRCVIISSSEVRHFRVGMLFQAFQSALRVDTGRCYGHAVVKSVTEGFAAIQFLDEQTSMDFPEHGMIALKFMGKMEE